MLISDETFENEALSLSLYHAETNIVGLVWLLSGTIPFHGRAFGCPWLEVHMMSDSQMGWMGDGNIVEAIVHHYQDC